jgi:hypothetical protein
MRVIEESKTPSAQLIDQAKSDAKEFHRLATNWQGDEETLHMKLLQFPGRADEIRAKTNETDRKWSAQIKPLMTTANGVRQELLQRIPSKPTDEDAIVAATFAKSVVGQPISEVELEDASRYLDALAERASPR